MYTNTRYLAVALTASLLWTTQGTSQTEALSQGETPMVEGMEALTQGPIHEAFASSLSLTPVGNTLVAEPPPEPIEEVPPESGPGNASWISGYWFWDDQQKTYLWISGVWRVPPPGSIWISGYWNQTDDGYQFVSGFWSRENSSSVEYLPDPPKSLEAGPTSPQPGNEYFWITGNWIWAENRYQWQPGYWGRSRTGYVWYPSYYSWTPSGSLFVNGYWDYPFAQRGLPFAPIRFTQPLYNEPGYTYRPSVCLNLGVLPVHLFVRSIGSTYFFGDYYGNNYFNQGYYPWYLRDNYREGFRRRYDPFYTYYRNTDPGFLTRLDQRYDYFLNNENARPSRRFGYNQESTRNRGDVPILASTLSQVRANPNLFQQNALVPTRESNLFRNFGRLREIQETERGGLLHRVSDSRQLQQRRSELETRDAPKVVGDEKRQPRRLDLSELRRPGTDGRPRQDRTDRPGVARERNQESPRERGRREFEAEANQPGRDTPAKNPEQPETAQPDRDRTSPRQNNLPPRSETAPADRRERPNEQRPNRNRTETERPTRPGTPNPTVATPDGPATPQTTPVPEAPSDRRPEARPPVAIPRTPDTKAAPPVPMPRAPVTKDRVDPRNPQRRVVPEDRPPNRPNVSPDGIVRPNQENLRRYPPQDTAESQGERRVRQERDPRRSGANQGPTPENRNPNVPDIRRQTPATPSLPTRPDGNVPTVGRDRANPPVLGPQNTPPTPRPEVQPRLNREARPESRPLAPSAREQRPQAPQQPRPEVRPQAPGEPKPPAARPDGQRENVDPARVERRQSNRAEKKAETPPAVEKKSEKKD